MQDKYLPTIARRKEIVLTQIAEHQVMIYRNNLSNLEFIAENQKNKQIEVETNNKILSEQIDRLLTELQDLEKLDASTSPSALSGNTPE